MGEKKISKEVEDTMACSAFAEAGEPCPIDSGDKAAEPKPKKEKSKSMSVEDTMACSAFAEAGEPCPIDKDKNKD